MPLLDSERERFLAIKAREDAKGKTLTSFEPSKFRDTAIDTHKTLPVEDWGPPGVGLPTRRHSRTLTNNSARFNPPKPITDLHRLWSDPAAVLNPSSIAFQGDSIDALRSVFEPTPDQREACLPAVQRRANKASSEWALLDTFQVQMTVNEQEAELQRRRDLQRSHKASLDYLVQLKKSAGDQLASNAATERLEIDSQFKSYIKQQSDVSQATRKQSKDLMDLQARTAAEKKMVTESMRREIKQREEQMLQRQAAQMELDREEAERFRQLRKDATTAALAEADARMETRRTTQRELKTKDAEVVQKLVDKMDQDEEKRKSDREARLAKVEAATEVLRASSSLVLATQKK
mmetsp:Transcript_31168/g.56592  ORF Transcript_31168/g.56592 Transcript_31168/m.56592 type:complete len:349 (-) Transcript_31168:893-1939(-)